MAKQGTIHRGPRSDPSTELTIACISYSFLVLQYMYVIYVTAKANVLNMCTGIKKTIYPVSLNFKCKITIIIKLQVTLFTMACTKAWVVSSLSLVDLFNLLLHPHFY